MEETTMTHKATTSSTQTGAGTSAGTTTTTLPGGQKEIDNWSRRSVMMIYGGCMFFVPKRTKIVQGENHLIGRCRALPPTMKGWPVVFSDDWCGNHKLDEEKI